MIRQVCLGILALVAASASASAQFGGMGGMGGGMGGMGGRGMGGVGMGGMGFPAQTTVERMAVVEAEGGQKLTGKIMLQPVAVAGDLGQYEIRPQHVKAIRFANKPAAASGPIDGQPSPQATVITTAGKEITGGLMVSGWTLELEFGSLALDASKIKAITFSPPAEGGKGSEPRAAAAPTGRLKVTSIEGPNVAALYIEGPNITRVAASNGLSGDWVHCELRAPFSGRAMPIVGPGVVVYALGSNIYAFSAEHRTWDVLELPAGTRATPIVGPSSVRVQQGNQTHEFTAAGGKWKHVDLQAILEQKGRGEADVKAVEPKP